MGQYRSYAYHNYEISKEQYNYMLPVYSRCAYENVMLKESIYDNPIIVERSDKYMFCGTPEDYKDMLERCKYL